MAHFDPKPAIVGGASRFHQLVAGGDPALGLQPFLQLALRIQLRSDRLERRTGDGLTKRTRGVETALQEDGGDQRLDRVGEHVRGVAQAGRFGTATQAQRFGEIVLAGPMRERFGADQLRAHAREHAFVRIRLAHEQQLTDTEPEHRVTQELQPLVVGEVGALVRVAGMRQRFFQTRNVGGEPNEGRDAFALLREVVSHGGADLSISSGKTHITHCVMMTEEQNETLPSRACRLLSMRLGYSAVMAALQACPFCRKLYTSDEARTCPDCEVALVGMSQLPPSLDALEEEAERGALTLPEHQLLPTSYLGSGRGALVALSLLGIAAFFLPWVELQKPESVVYSAFDLARGRAGWLWGGVTAWFVLIPLVLSRRTIARLRGIRVVAVMFAAMTLTEALMLWLIPPRRGLTPLELHFRYGLFLSGAISLVASLVAARLGGSLDNLPKFLLDTRQSPDRERAQVSETSDGRTLH
jgi:hypothetical protein